MADLTSDRNVLLVAVSRAVEDPKYGDFGIHEYYDYLKKISDCATRYREDIESHVAVFGSTPKIDDQAIMARKIRDMADDCLADVMKRMMNTVASIDREAKA